MRQWMAGFVNHLTSTLRPGAWRLDSDAFADCAKRQCSINLGLYVTADANMITTDHIEAAKLEVHSVRAIRQSFESVRPGAVSRCLP